MRPAFLHLDDALLAQAKLLSDGLECGGRTLDARAIGPVLRLWGRPDAIGRLRDLLQRTPYNPTNPDVFFCGSGDFHHVAYLLVERAISALSRPVTILHFDNHPDWVRFPNGMHCGSWVARTSRLPNVSAFITVGVCSADIDNPGSKRADLSVAGADSFHLFAFRAPEQAPEVTIGARRWPTIEYMGEDAFCDHLLSKIRTPLVYISLDKDVLRAGEAITNWDQGEIGFDFLEHMIKRVARRHRIVGADIVGDWSAPVYGGDLTSIWLKYAEALLDQPWRRPKAVHAQRINEPVNRRLLHLFTEAQA